MRRHFPSTLLHWHMADATHEDWVVCSEQSAEHFMLTLSQMHAGSALQAGALVYAYEQRSEHCCCAVGAELLKRHIA